MIDPHSSPDDGGNAPKSWLPTAIEREEEPVRLVKNRLLRQILVSRYCIRTRINLWDKPS